MVSRAFIILLLSLALASCGGNSSYWSQSQTHVVRKGDTLFSISWRYGKDPDDVARWNKLGDGSLIYPGQVIRLTPPSGTSTRSTAASRPVRPPMVTTVKKTPLRIE